MQIIIWLEKKFVITVKLTRLDREKGVSDRIED